MINWFRTRSKIVAENRRLKAELSLEKRLRQEERETYETQMRAAVESLDRIAQANAYEAALFRGARESHRLNGGRLATVG